MAPRDFEQAAGFEQGEIGGGVHLGKFEAHYEEIFAEVIEDGIITAEERARLDRAADSLGLDKERLRKLEKALRVAYEARHQTRITDLSGRAPSMLDEAELVDEGARPTLTAVGSMTGHAGEANALASRVAFLEARIHELERQLADARSQIAVEVDLSYVDAAPATSVGDDDVESLLRRLHHDPRDPALLRALYGAYERSGDAERRHGVAQALVYVGAASADEKKVYDAGKALGLIRPTTSLSPDAWRRFLFHPEDEILTGEIFSVVVSAVLLGRVSALRRDKLLPHLDPAARQDPNTSTVQAVRCFSWASAILGMSPPALYADPSFAGLVDVVPGVPPATRLGEKALAGRSPQELAFAAGHHLAWYREEHFVRCLVPSIADLEDLFLAALSIGNPGLPLGPEARRRVGPLANAIEPILESVQVDRLRGYFLRFVEDGGRTNLQRWATAAERTAARAGFLLAGDLKVAETMLGVVGKGGTDAMDDLLVFVTSDRYANARKQLGIALPSRATA